MVVEFFLQENMSMMGLQAKWIRLNTFDIQLILQKLLAEDGNSKPNFNASDH